MSSKKQKKAQKKAEKKYIIRNSTAEFLIFTIQAGEDGIEVRVEDENIWLTQKLIAKLFDVRIPTINEHLKNIFSTNELQENSVVRKFLITADDGKHYNTKHYNLESIIALGYRISMMRKFYKMLVKLQLKSLNLLLKANLKNIVLFKTATLNLILTEK